MHGLSLLKFIRSFLALVAFSGYQQLHAMDRGDSAYGFPAHTQGGVQGTASSSMTLPPDLLAQFSGMQVQSMPPAAAPWSTQPMPATSHSVWGFPTAPVAAGQMPMHTPPVYVASMSSSASTPLHPTQPATTPTNPIQLSAEELRRIGITPVRKITDICHSISNIQPGDIPNLPFMIGGVYLILRTEELQDDEFEPTAAIISSSASSLFSQSGAPQGGLHLLAFVHKAAVELGLYDGNAYAKKLASYLLRASAHEILMVGPRYLEVFADNLPVTHDIIALFGGIFWLKLIEPGFQDATRALITTIWNTLERVPFDLEPTLHSLGAQALAMIAKRDPELTGAIRIQAFEDIALKVLQQEFAPEALDLVYFAFTLLGTLLNTCPAALKRVDFDAAIQCAETLLGRYEVMFNPKIDSTSFCQNSTPLIYFLRKALKRLGKKLNGDSLTTIKHICAVETARELRQDPSYAYQVFKLNQTCDAPAIRAIIQLTTHQRHGGSSGKEHKKRGKR